MSPVQYNVGTVCGTVYCHVHTMYSALYTELVLCSTAFVIWAASKGPLLSGKPKEVICFLVSLWRSFVTALVGYEIMRYLDRLQRSFVTYGDRFVT